MKAGAFFLALTLLAFALAACAGFDFGDVVRVPTPTEVQQTEGLPSRMSLNQSAQKYQAWLDDVQRAGAEWKTSIERGHEFANILGQLTLGALEDVGPAVAGVPVLSGAAVFVPSLISWFVGRSQGKGAEAQKWQEKIDSYNKALQRKGEGTESS